MNPYFFPENMQSGLLLRPSNWVFLALKELEEAKVVAFPLPFVNFVVTCNAAVSSYATEFAG